jgi:hypothetical protein
LENFLCNRFEAVRIHMEGDLVQVLEAKQGNRASMQGIVQHGKPVLEKGQDIHADENLLWATDGRKRYLLWGRVQEGLLELE